MKKKIAIILMCICLIVSLATLIFYKIGDMIINTALDNILYETIEADTPDNSNSVNISDVEDNKSPSGNASSNEVSGETDATTNSINTDITKKPTNSKNTLIDNQPTDDKVKKQDPLKQMPDVTKPVVAPDQIKKIKESVTASDKFNVSALVFSKLSPKEISRLMGFLSGGITAEEKAEAKGIAFSKFSSDEIKEIYKIYKNYTAQ